MDISTSESKGFIQRFMERAEFDRFSIISVGFLLIGIVGGITVAFFAREHIWQIGLIAGLTMLSLSLMLAVAPIKQIIRFTLLALAVDVILMIVNLF